MSNVTGYTSVLVNWLEKEVKKESETTTTELYTPGEYDTVNKIKNRSLIKAILIGASAATTVTIEDGTTAIATIQVPAAGASTWFEFPGQGFLTKQGGAVKIKSSNTAKLNLTVYGTETPN